MRVKREREMMSPDRGTLKRNDGWSVVRNEKELPKEWALGPRSRRGREEADGGGNRGGAPEPVRSLHGRR